MVTIAAKPPFKYFTELDGTALVGGKIYIGVAGLDAEANPIPVYWDDAGTILAPQPIRTIAGVPENGGSPSDFFVSSDYSITVRDANDALVYSKLQLNADEALAVTEVRYKTIAELIAATDTLPEGAIVSTKTEGEIYRVAPSGATDQHLINAAGVKFYEAGFNFSTRDVRTATDAAAYNQGQVVLLRGESLLVDSTATGSDSATSDLGVDGLRLISGKQTTASWIAGTAGPGLPPVVSTSGYTTPGDHGGAEWFRVETEPTHTGKRQFSAGSSTSWYELRADAVTPEMFGASEAAANSATELDNAISYGRTQGVTLDAGWREYNLTSALTEVPGIVQRLALDASGLIAPEAWRVAAAEYEAANTITANTLQGSRLFSATSHGYSVGDIVLIRSNKVFETASNSVCAHWGKITAVTADTFTTHEAALCNLMTADNAIVQRLPATNRADVELKITGGTQCHNGFWATRFSDLTVRSFEGVNLAQRCVVFAENYRPHLMRATGINAGFPGLGYVCAASGNGWIRADYLEGLRCRHVITFGETGAIPSVGGTFGDVIGAECLAAAIDTHPGVLNVFQTGTTIADMSSELTAEDGVTWQGVGGRFNIEFLDGQSPRHGIALQPFHDMTAFEEAPSYSFTARAINAAESAVVLDIDGCDDIRTITADMTGTGATRGFLMTMGDNALDVLELSGEVVAGSARAMQVVCASNSDLGFVRQSGSWEAGGNEASYIIGATDAGSRRTRWAVTGIQSFGGTWGLRALNRVDAKLSSEFLEGSSGESVAGGGATIT